MRAKNPNDHQAWEDFVEYYGNFIYIVISSMKLPVDQRDDLVQTVLIRLWKNLSKYDENHERARFRSWLGTIIRNEVNRHYSKQNRKKNRETNAEDLGIDLAFFEDKSEDNFNSYIEKEWQVYISNLAMKELEKIFTGNALEVFSMTLDGISVKEISEQLNIKEDSVYMLRSRVKARFSKEVKRLRDELENV